MFEAPMAVEHTDLAAAFTDDHEHGQEGDNRSGRERSDEAVCRDGLDAFEGGDGVRGAILLTDDIGGGTELGLDSDDSALEVCHGIYGDRAGAHLPGLGRQGLEALNGHHQTGVGKLIAGIKYPDHGDLGAGVGGEGRSNHKIILGGQGLADFGRIGGAGGIEGCPRYKLEAGSIHGGRSDRADAGDHDRQAEGPLGATGRSIGGVGVGGAAGAIPKGTRDR